VRMILEGLLGDEGRYTAPFLRLAILNSGELAPARDSLPKLEDVIDAGPRPTRRYRDGHATIGAPGAQAIGLSR
jgi:hypothetical protein